MYFIPAPQFMYFRGLPRVDTTRSSDAGPLMPSGDGNWHVSETLARLVDEQLVAAMWRLELRLYMLLAVAFCASLAAHLFMLGQLQLKLHLFKLDRAQREQRRARRRLQSAGAQVLEGSSSLPEHEPSAPSRARRRHMPTRRAASDSDLGARPGTRLLQRWTNETSNEPAGTRSAPGTGVDARPGTSLLQRPHEASATSGLRPAAPAVHHGHKHRTAL